MHSLKKIKTLLTVGTLMCVSTPCHTNLGIFSIHSSLIAGINQEYRTQSTQPIYLQVSQIWEGSHIDPINLQAIHRFREQYAGIPITQFLNPAYYSKRNAQANMVTSQIATTIRPDDGFGLHLHGWRSFVTEAGIVFRDSPTFWGNVINQSDCAKDCGHEVPLTSYTEPELIKLLQHSRSVLKRQGFPNTEHFLAGGWISGPHILRAIGKTGFRFDYSAVPPELLSSRLKYYPIGQWLKNIWKNQSSITQPHIKKTGDHYLTQVGTSMASIDYLTENQIFEQFKTYADMQKKDPNRGLYFHLSFYHETASQHLPRLAKALQMIFSYSHQENILLQPTTLFSDKQQPIEISAEEPVNSNHPAH